MGLAGKLVSRVPAMAHTLCFYTFWLICRRARHSEWLAKSDLPQGTLDLLILKVVALGPVHGYAIAQRLQQVSRDVVQVPQGLAVSGAAPARNSRAFWRRNGMRPRPGAKPSFIT